MTSKWDHTTKPSTFVVSDNGKEVYRGPFQDGFKLLGIDKEKVFHELKRLQAENEELKENIKTLRQYLREDNQLIKQLEDQLSKLSESDNGVSSTG